MKSIGVVAAVAFVCTGCVSSFAESVPLNSPPHPLVPRPPGSVEVFASAPPARPHVDVALLRADQPDYGSVDMPRLVQSLLEQAAKLGCDALFISGAAGRAGASDLHLLDPGSNVLLGTCLAYLPDPGYPPSSASDTVNAVVIARPVAKSESTIVVDDVTTGMAVRR